MSASALRNARARAANAAKGIARASHAEEHLSSAERAAVVLSSAEVRKSGAARSSVKEMVLGRKEAILQKEAARKEALQTSGLQTSASAVYVRARPDLDPCFTRSFRKLCAFLDTRLRYPKSQNHGGTTVAMVAAEQAQTRAKLLAAEQRLALARVKASMKAEPGPCPRLADALFVSIGERLITTETDRESNISAAR